MCLNKNRLLGFRVHLSWSFTIKVQWLVYLKSAAGKSCFTVPQGCLVILCLVVHTWYLCVHAYTHTHTHTHRITNAHKPFRGFFFFFYKSAAPNLPLRRLTSLRDKGLSEVLSCVRELRCQMWRGRCFTFSSAELERRTTGNQSPWDSVWSVNVLTSPDEYKHACVLPYPTQYTGLFECTHRSKSKIPIHRYLSVCRLWILKLEHRPQAFRSRVFVWVKYKSTLASSVQSHVLNMYRARATNLPATFNSFVVWRYYF